MKIANLSLIALLLLTFTACDDSDNDVVQTPQQPEKTLLLKLTVDPSFSSDDYDDWILIHSEDGSLLAYESFESNQELEMFTDKPVTGKVSVTHLKFEDGEAKYFTGKSFSDISVGKHLSLKKSAPRPTSNGKFEVTIQDIPSFDFFSISSRVGYLGSTSYNRNAGTVKLTTFTYPDVSTFIVTASDGTTPRYKVVKNVQPDDTYIVSLDDMDPFDEEVAFSFPETDDVYLEVEASDSAPGTPNNYLVMSRYIRESGTTLSAWYTDEFTNYRTYLNIRYPEYTYRYKSIGSIPSASVTWPQYSNFDIEEQSFIGYSAVANEQYVWRSTLFEYDDDVKKVYGSWEISTASGKNLIIEIPSEVATKYPDFTFDKLQHKSTTFYTKSPAFDSIVNNQFEGAPDPDGVQVGLVISTETD